MPPEFAVPLGSAPLMKFTYRSGQRPLEGYTIKRGVGKGGFGEVYFALSDGGKEVALKLLHIQSEIELRGAANCLNLKHPNLVHVYDLKEDSQGDKWLVMEYVLGESLSAVIDRHPNGLPLSMVREWFAALCRAVAHLHDRGVVHRDLKPANIFIEAGTLKVGDYGLCKSVSVSQKQTRTVGTVHYMAPEVSTGNYTQKIDQYACCLILVEMLTGKLVFDGETDGEILMKHLTAKPNLTTVPETLQPVIARALDKNPIKRYPHINDLAREVDQRLEALQLASAGSKRPVAVAASVPTGQQTPPAPEVNPVVAEQPPPGMSRVADKPTVRLFGLGAWLPVAKKAKPAVQPPPLPIIDQAQSTAMPAATEPLPLARPITWRTRLTARLGAALAVPFLVALAMLAKSLLSGGDDWVNVARQGVVTIGCAWVVLFASGSASSRLSESYALRLLFGLLGASIGVLAYWLDGWAIPNENYTVLARYALYFGLIFAAGRWWKSVARDRKERLSLFPVIVAGFWSAVMLFLWPVETVSIGSGMLPMILAIIVCQLTSPWSPAVVVQAPKKLRLRGLA